MTTPPPTAALTSLIGSCTPKLLLTEVVSITRHITTISTGTSTSTTVTATTAAS